MKQDDLDSIIVNHGLWLQGDKEGTRANLSGANLSHANLSHANLSGVAGERTRVKSIFVSDVYAITYTSDVLQIGCERHSITKWWEFDDSKIIQMEGKKALKFWREYKDFIRQTIEQFPARAAQ